MGTDTSFSKQMSELLCKLLPCLSQIGFCLQYSQFLSEKHKQTYVETIYLHYYLPTLDKVFAPIPNKNLVKYKIIDENQLFYL